MYVFSEASTRHAISRSSYREFQKGDIVTEVKSINGVAILPVADGRMKSAYTFYDGATSGEEAGGFVPTDSAKNIGLIVMPKRGASLVKKTERVRTFAPDQNQAADAYKFDYRTYYDLIIRNSVADSVYAFVYGN